MDAATSMTGKTVLVTGGTGGIGRAAAVALASMGARVGIAGRDRTRAEHAAAAITGESGNPAVDVFVADMSSQAEVRRLADEVLAAYPRLDVLLNNVGGFWAHRHVTADGLEHTFALNHLAPFLLTNLLLDRLVASRARVVTTASDAHTAGRLDLDDLQSERGHFRPGRVYGTSKLCNVLFTRELQRRNEAIAANCFHPGVIRTGFGKNDGALTRIGLTLAGPFLRSPEAGARTLVWLALDPDAAGLRGQYLEKGRPAEPSSQARDDRLAAELWERSAKLCPLTGSPFVS
jgi:retinol dehydrogenase 14